MRDFVSEIPCYLYAERVIDLVAGCTRSQDSVSSNLYNAYEALHKNQIVPKQELPLVEAWLKDLN